MNHRTTLMLAMGLGGALVAGMALGHGNVTPQKVDTRALEPLGEEWVEENPYRAPYDKHELAVEVGKSAYSENCARCHGLEAVSGGIAPDLRELESTPYGDEWFVERVVNGAGQMPKMADYLSQEALWAIRTYVESLETE
ncbi:cytochrome c-550 PedF [Halomonas maura]|uniref:cytochrome c-550 PedF n=1 Tax=Halomonas maura TaxID=117606 RepID=UPI0025B3DCA8|nr:cytochrome c-550 PedF [Halomonas maura]MDN3557765.1 cytochrome c-550 PedF [Halomonas maura]